MGCHFLLQVTSSGDTQTQFCLSLCGVSESWCTQGMFEPSEHLWWLWGLILNVISSLLPSCWGFSFALGCGVSPQNLSSSTQPPLPCCAAAAPVASLVAQLVKNLIPTSFIFFYLLEQGKSKPLFLTFCAQPVHLCLFWKHESKII